MSHTNPSTMESPETYIEKPTKQFVKIQVPNVSVHGISHARENSGNIKLQVFWLFIFVIGFGGMIYFIQDRLFDFIDSGVTTSFQYNYENNLPMPEVTICSMNSWDDTEVKYVGVILKEKIENNFDKVKYTFKFKLAIVDYLWGRIEFYKLLVEAGRGGLLEKYWHFTHYFKDSRDEVHRVTRRLQNRER